MKNTKTLVTTSLCSAMLCVVSPFVIPLPISPVPVSLAVCVIFISAFILPPLNCTVSVFVYLMIGAVGLPVFSGFTGGLSVIAGPTGGYLIGYLAAAFVSSWFNSKSKKVYIRAIGMSVGLITIYFTGTVWFCFSQNTNIISALMLCVFPYLVGDVIKIAAATFIGKKLCNYNIFR